MGQMPDQLAQSPGVYGLDLFDENAGGSPSISGLGRNDAGRPLRDVGGNDDYRSGQELVGMYHHGKAITVLLVTDNPRQTETVDFDL